MKNILLILLLFIIVNNCYSQCEKKYEQNLVWIIVQDTSIIVKEKDGKVKIKNTELNNVLVKNKLISIKKSFPQSKNELLQHVYTVKFDSNLDTLCIEMNKKCKEDVCKVVKRTENKSEYLYSPSDFAYTSNWLWPLDKIQANLAWDITKGSQLVSVAIIDGWFDVEHPDLQSKIYPPYDPYDNLPFYAKGPNVARMEYHGTTVAGFVAGQTDGGGHIASVGFNTRIIGYKNQSEFIERAYHASFTMGAKVISSSVGHCAPSDPLEMEIEMATVKEILDNGTVIVQAAGNGVPGPNCREAGSNEDQPLYPFHPSYDSRIIIVSSTDNLDNHTSPTIVNNVPQTYSHYPEVDICAPGYNAGTCLTMTKNLDGTTNTWPYSSTADGTSFSAPQVAGVCALMLSINPCLTPAEIENIIKITADPITDANLYPGLVGAGRINAYKAVKLAGTKNIVSMNVYNWIPYITAGYNLNLTDITVYPYLICKARNEISITGPFEIPPFRTLTLEVNPEIISNCP